MCPPKKNFFNTLSMLQRGFKMLPTKRLTQLYTARMSFPFWATAQHSLGCSRLVALRTFCALENCMHYVVHKLYRMYSISRTISERGCVQRVRSLCDRALYVVCCTVGLMYAPCAHACTRTQNKTQCAHIATKVHLNRTKHCSPKGNSRSKWERAVCSKAHIKWQRANENSFWRFLVYDHFPISKWMSYHQ